MKTPLLPVATAVLGIAVGFIAGKGGGSGGEKVKEDGPLVRNGSGTRQGSTRGAGAGGQRADSSSEAVLSAFLKGKSPTELTAEEAFALLKPQMNMDWYSDPLEAARMNYQYQLLASKLPLAVMEDVLALAREGGVPPYRANQLFGAYAARDWEKAMAWAEKQPDAGTLRSVAISRLAQDDPARASELYQQELMTGASRMAGWEASYSLASSYARLGQAEFFKFLDGLPSGSASNLLSNGARNLPKEDVATFLAQVQKRAADGKMEGWAMNNLISNLAGTRGEEVRKWVETMEPGSKRAELEISLAGSLSRQGKPGEVDELLRSAMAGAAGKEKEFVKERGGNLIGQNPEVMEKLVNLLPEGQELTREDVKQWAGYGFGRTDTMLDLAKLIRSPEEQAAYLVESFNGMGGTNNGNRNLNAKDFEILSHRLQAMDLSAETATQAKTALESAREKVLGK